MFNRANLIHFGRPKPLSFVACRSGATSSLDKAEVSILDSYWLRRGVLEDQTRTRLVDLATVTLPSNTAPANPDFARQLPGIATTWVLEDANVQAIIKELSKRLLRLNALLGTVYAAYLPFHTRMHTSIRMYSLHSPYAYIISYQQSRPRRR